MKQFKKIPSLWIVPLLILGFGIGGTFVGYECMRGWLCSADMGSILFQLGILCLLAVLVVIIIPYSVRGCLNACYPIKTVPIETINPV